MTDEMLAWQTERFLALAERREPWSVVVRPEQVVEIAFDGLQRSTRYPRGLALRFARVLRYRDDKTADEADAIDAVRALAVTRSRCRPRVGTCRAPCSTSRTRTPLGLALNALQAEWRYREDRPADETDAIEAVQALLDVRSPRD